MNELTNEKFMTIKDFIELTGLSDRNVRRAIKKLFPDKIKRGKKTVIYKNESDKLLKELRIKELPNIGKNAEVNNQYITRVELAEFGKTIVSEMFKQMLPLLQQNNNQIEFK